MTLNVVLCLILGPGCSSLGYGAFMEHGPFQPGDNGLLVKNKYSWNLGKCVYTSSLSSKFYLFIYYCYLFIYF